MQLPGSGRCSRLWDSSGYSDQAQGTLESLVAMPSLLGRVIESQEQDI